jgi:hypothetical protein
VASSYGLAKVTQIRITARAGGGVWGGIVTAAYVDGLDSAGHAQSVAATGPGLASALGTPYQYFKIVQLAPMGSMDQFARVGLGTLHVRGWVLDPMRPTQSSQVRIYVGSRPYVIAANLARPDVQRAFGTSMDRYGFDTTIALTGGTYSVCSYAMDAALVTHSSLGCRTVSVPVNPLAAADKLTKVAPNSYRLVGWAFDPDADGGSTQVHLYVDSVGHPLLAQLSRPDVQRYYGLKNAAVGFDARVPVPAGTHTLCAYAINTVGAGVNRQFGCWRVTG